jgi:hypothetical protein
LTEFEKGTDDAEGEKVPTRTGALEKTGGGLLFWITPLEFENDPPALWDGPLELGDELPAL